MRIRSIASRIAACTAPAPPSSRPTCRSSDPRLHRAPACVGLTRTAACHHAGFSEAHQ